MTTIKKVISALLTVCILAAMCACNSQGAETSSTVSGEDPAVDNANSVDRFYEARAFSWAGTYNYGYHAWHGDGSFWVQDLNSINVIGRDNALMKTITLDESKLPSTYVLTWNENRILAIRKESEDSRYEYGAVYQADGKISLCGVSVWDIDGRLIKEYPSFPLYGEEGEVITTPEGAKIDWQRNLYDGTVVYWLDDHTIAINGHSRVILYDLDSDTGRVVDEMVELVEKYGKFGVYYGVEYFFCYVYNGDFYYLAHKNEEKSNGAGTIWRVGKDDVKASVMFEGKEFTHLFMNGSTMVLTEMDDAPEYGYNLWWADTQQGILNEMGYYKVNIPFVIDGQRISMRADAPELYCYDREQSRENALTIVKPEDFGDIVGTRLSSDGDLQFVFSASYVTEDVSTSFYVMDAKSGEKICVYKGYLYDSFSLSPDKSCGVVFSSGEQNDLPQVRIIQLDLLK